MKPTKKKKSKEDAEFNVEPTGEEGTERPIPFGALAELTSSDVIAEVKRGMSAIEPIDLEDESNEDAA